MQKPKRLRLVLVIGLVIYALHRVTVEKDTKNSAQKYNNIVLAESNNQISLQFNTQIQIGNPLVFGGAQMPLSTQHDAWDLIKDVGITQLRRDIFIEKELKKDVTVEKYLENRENESMWNTDAIKQTNEVFENAKSRNIKVMAILSYIPGWLGINGTNSLPKNWEVYKDVVKKSYLYHRPYIDIIEIWNEPDKKQFMNLTGTGKTVSQAYEELFLHSVEAINEVDSKAADGKTAFIIGPATSNPNSQDIINPLLSQVSLSKHLNGLSFHNYSENYNPTNKYAMVAMDKTPTLPLFITEWNYSADYTTNPFLHTSRAIPFTSRTLLNFINNGVAGSNYYSTDQYNPESVNKYENVYGFYTIKEGITELLPQGKTWRLLSKTLGLGQGPSTIVKTETTGQTATGFINSEGQYGLAFVNEENTPQLTSISLENLPLKTKATVRVFRASEYDDGSKEICSKELPVKNGVIEFKTLIPEYAVQGVLIEPVKLTAQMLLNILGISTTADCIITSNTN